MAVFKLSRRRLLIGAAGATVVAGGAGLWLGIDHLADRRYRKAVHREGYAFAPSVYLAITPDDWVTIWLTRSEMGQGVSTSLPMIVCEELDADWERVRVEQAVAGDGFDYGSMFTAASSSVSSMWHELRMAGATARAMLVAAAAERWGVSASACKAIEGSIECGAQRLRFGDLAAAASEKRPPVRPALKAPSAFSLLNTSPRRPDVAEIVDGSATFGIDVRVPGLRFAALLRPPKPGAKLLQFSSDKAVAVPGVEEVAETAVGVAVIASNSFAARKGVSLIEADWDMSGARSLGDEEVEHSLSIAMASESFTQMKARTLSSASPPNPPAADELITEYSTPYLAHACMEPMNATVELTSQRCRIWVGTQAADGIAPFVSSMTGLPEDRVEVHVARLGGGFGRRAALDYVREAIDVARATVGPVQLAWSREEDLTQGEYREASRHRLRASLNHQVSTPLLHLEHRVVTASRTAYEPGQQNVGSTLGAADAPYRFEGHRVLWRSAQIPVSTRIWRSVGHGYNCFALESFLDEVATRIGEDPLTFRLRLLEEQPRLKHCLSVLADYCDWSRQSAEAGVAGLAASHCMGSFIAVAIKAVRQTQERVLIRGIWAVADCGQIVHRDGLLAQLEGGLLDGLRAALDPGVSFQAGVTHPNNFDRLRSLRLPEVPELNIRLIDNSATPSGAGELGVPAVAPALANSLARLTGVRQRDLPIRLEVEAGSA